MKVIAFNLVIELVLEAHNPVGLCGRISSSKVVDSGRQLAIGTKVEGNSKGMLWMDVGCAHVQSNFKFMVNYLFS